MTHHMMSITYGPKIAAVCDGTCTQIIRKGNRVSVGDTIIFHGWEGKPYRSKWNWRKRVFVTEVIPMYATEYGFTHTKNMNAIFYPWDDAHADEIAAMDFISPPHGLMLARALAELNGGNIDGEYQIIRWG